MKLVRYVILLTIGEFLFSESRTDDVGGAGRRGNAEIRNSQKVFGPGELV